MRKDFSGLDVAVAVLTATALTVIFASKAAPGAEYATSASANACAQWHLSAADFNECQSLWSTARTRADRKAIENRFLARGMVIPVSRRSPVGGAADTDAAGRLGPPHNLSAVPPK